MVCMVSGVVFQAWNNGTLGNTLSGCVTQDPRVGASEASAIHPTHTNVCVWNVDTCRLLNSHGVTVRLTVSAVNSQSHSGGLVSHGLLSMSTADLPCHMAGGFN